MNRVGPSKILYVDDDEDLIHIYTRFLEGGNYMLKTASNGEEGLATALEYIPDLIISDVAMPGMDGLELCRQVRAHESLQGAVFMLVSGIDVEGQDVVTGLEAGADEYLVKPFSRDELLARIALLLGIKELKAKASNADIILQDELNHRDLLEVRLAELKDELASEREALSGALKQVKNLVDERQKAIERAEAETLKASRTLDACVDILVRSMDLKPGFKRGHGADVAALAVAIGTEMGLGEQALATIEMAARLHPLGMLSVAEALATRNPLEWTQAETDLLSHHPARAGVMLGKVEGLEAVAHLVRHMLERIDGDGTPKGLKQEAIPLGSRILAVADAYETLKAWAKSGGIQECLDRLEEEAGTRFDPKVVHALGRHLGRKPESEAGNRVEMGIYEVEPGMELASAIYTAKGAMLLPENTILTEEYIRQIARYNRIDPLEETVFIKG